MMKEKNSEPNSLLDNPIQLKSIQSSSIFKMLSDEAKHNRYLKCSSQHDDQEFYLVASNEERCLAPIDLPTFTIREFRRMCDEYSNSN